MESVAHRLAETRFRGGINYSLDRLMAPLAVLGDPHLQLPNVIHVAGTNGKGSTVTYMALALQLQGYRVATYTSPHLYTYQERFKVDGALISESDFCRLYEEVSMKTSSYVLTEFELLTMMFFLYVLEQGADFVVLETGIGGRLDATNVVTPVLSIITRIGMDHHEYLGDTLVEIAKEKAGIIKEGIPVVTCSGQEPSVLSLIKTVSDRLGSLWMISDDSDLSLETVPLFQLENLGMVRSAMSVLPGVRSIEAHEWRILGESTIEGRFQVIQSGEQCMVMDVGHNVLGIERVVSEYRRQFPGVSPLIVFALSKGRSPSMLLPILETLSKEIYYFSVETPYLLPYQELVAMYPGLKSVSCMSELASFPNVLVTGSFYLMGMLNRRTGR